MRYLPTIFQFQEDNLSPFTTHQEIRLLSAIDYVIDFDLPTLTDKSAITRVFPPRTVC